MLPVLALVLVSTPDPLHAAARHLNAGNLDAVVLDLADEVALAPDQRGAAAALLVDAAQQARSKKDGVLALQLAQMAHRRDEGSPAALELLGELALSEHDDAEAERWTDAWQKREPESPRPGLLHARIAADEGDWDTVRTLAGTLADDATLPAAGRKQARALLAQAETHRPAEAAHDPAEDMLRRAAEAAARERQQSFAARAAPAEPSVIIYGTSWCHFCKDARAYFAERNVPFEDKDIEQDHAANAEMTAKLRAVGRTAHGVPVLDVHGTMIEGFNKGAIEQALAK